MNYVACVLLAATLTGCATSLHVVAVPVADLRAQPGGLAKPNTPACHEECGAGRHDPLQETQVLYGERLRLIKTQDAWAFVEAVEQPEYTHNQRWQGYPGWMPKDALAPLPRRAKPNAIVMTKWATIWQDSQGTKPWFQLPLGTKLAITSMAGGLWRLQLANETPAWISRGNVRLVRELKRLAESKRRQMILLVAAEFLGDPYFWGGRSPFAGPTAVGATGVDCSGLVNLAYRAAGIDIPRDAHEQYLRARKIARPKPADLVFLSEPDNPAKIVHVMLYAGDGWLIEGPGTGLVVRRIMVAQRLGRPVEQVAVGDQSDRQTVFFGSYLP